MNGGKEKDCKRVKDKNGILAMGWGYVREIWKEYFEDLYSLNTEEEVCVVQDRSYWLGL